MSMRRICKNHNYDHQ